MTDTTSTTAALVFITGASRGLGAALASTVPFPARVVDISRSGAGGFDTIAADLARPASWTGVAEAMAREPEDFTGQRVVFLHCAGTLAPIGFVDEVDSDGYRDNVLVNSAAGQVLGHHFLHLTRDLGVPRQLVMITSGAATSAYPGWSAYGAGKAALDQWVRTVGAEQAHRGGALVVSIAPGVVATAMQEHIRAQDERDFPAVDRFRRLHREGDLRDPDEVARQLWRVLDSGLDNGAVLDLRRVDVPEREDDGS